MSTIDDRMSTNEILDALFPRTRIGVLRELESNEEGLHLRELERRTGVNSHHLSRELHALRDAGILKARRVGRQDFYRLNPDCLIYPELRSLIRKTVGLAGVLANALESFRNRIELAYIYGSQARGDIKPGSDVDLMLVGTMSLRQVSSALREAGRALGRVINPTLYSPREYEEELATADSFAARVHTGPRINLIGGNE